MYFATNKVGILKIARFVYLQNINVHFTIL
jgi:hypothetical protein